MEKARFDKMLAFEEIRAIITALGCGIGEEDFNIGDLRYHKVVIMTDADVDGSHIRTLLLTFFYRQMPELIERGHLYIAQPPLYRLKKGKSEFYLHDDKSFEAFVINAGADGAVVKGQGGKITLRGQELEKFLFELSEAIRILDVFENGAYERQLLAAFASLPQFNRETLKDEAQLKAACEEAKQWVLSRSQGLDEINFQFSNDEEHGAFVVQASARKDGERFPVKINFERVSSEDFIELQSLLSKAEALGLPPFLIEAEEGKKMGDLSCQSLFDLREKIMERGRSGLTVTRFKGLGEMNPEQLWETTLDKDKRSMLQVRIEDSINADALFTLLMGDAVEPRREFIEDNALKVKNLDI